VEEIIERIKPWVSAVSLAGAGGGGFMYILAKSKSDAKNIRAALNKNPPSRYSRFYDFEIDNQGLCLSAICK
jgi:mevalonate kinase